MRAILLLALFGCVLLATVSAQLPELDDLFDPEEAEFQKRNAAQQQNDVGQEGQNDDEESNDDTLEDDDEESEDEDSQDDGSQEDDSHDDEKEDASQPEEKY
ncbi:uncharacterized protein Dana_GF10746 [Drosophila ananassae]|uniref:Uncharacterized protein n=1 Tax=Drosophila ananassae TaxID=7217 RepID=B3M747_DROAN|nr:trigger factor [Drosophila ananassae]EDV40912.1 uncharacterized protein Dana_GF10746 [Drosophila ananassae]